jgi:hypothetical protein
MKKEVFNVIIENLEERVQECEKHLSHIHNTDDLENISLKEAVELQKFCKTEQFKMTEIAMVDSYHVIGMGNLSAVQSAQFNRLLTNYLSYRSDIKAISNLTSINNLPKLPTVSKFKLLQLGDITLVSESRGNELDQIVFVDEEEVRDFSAAKEAAEAESQIGLIPVSLKLDGNKISLNIGDLPKFIKLCGFEADLNLLLPKIINNADYMGIKWKGGISKAGQIQGEPNIYILERLKKIL